MRTGINCLRAWVVGVLLVAGGDSGASVGSVLGTIRIEGARPARPKLRVYKHVEVCGEDIPDERLVLGPNGGLRYVVVTVEAASGETRARPEADLVLDNHDCRFEPHVQTAAVGQWVELRNSDPILHNADARRGQDTLFNVALTPGRRVRKPLDHAGVIRVTCDVRHTWMKAYIVVVDHPFHAVTDIYGDYEIRGLPPGKYVLRAWHEELGTQQHPVTIEADKATQQDITYPTPTAAEPPP